jgi:hypothetical protein
MKRLESLKEFNLDAIATSKINGGDKSTEGHHSGASYTSDCIWQDSKGNNHISKYEADSGFDENAIFGGGPKGDLPTLSGNDLTVAIAAVDNIGYYDGSDSAVTFMG